MNLFWEIYEEIERSKKRRRDNKQFRALYRDILKVARHEHCTCIYVDSIKDSNTTIRFYTPQNGIIYHLSDHGFSNLDRSELYALFMMLQYRTHGYLKQNYKEVGGGYNDTITSFSTGFTSTGSTGLYANRVGGGVGRQTLSYYLYLGRAAFEQRKADIKNRYAR